MHWNAQNRPNPCQSLAGNLGGRWRDEREKREEYYRQERYRKDDERTEKFVAAVEHLSRSIAESQAKCGVNQYLLDQLKKP